MAGSGVTANCVLFYKNGKLQNSQSLSSSVASPEVLARKCWSIFMDIKCIHTYNSIIQRQWQFDMTADTALSDFTNKNQ